MARRVGLERAGVTLLSLRSVWSVRVAIENLVNLVRLAEHAGDRDVVFAREWFHPDESCNPEATAQIEAAVRAAFPTVAFRLETAEEWATRTGLAATEIAP